MPNNQFDINVSNGVAIAVDNDVRRGWKYTPAFLNNQNHCYMPILNACLILDDDTQKRINILKVAIPLKWVIILAPPAKVRIS